MALFADSDRLLFFGNIDDGGRFRLLAVFIFFLGLDLDTIDFGWRKCLTNILGRIFAPGDDVDFLLVTDFIHDGTNANTAATDEGADWIDAGTI